jgi:hypothetical protein
MSAFGFGDGVTLGVIKRDGNGKARLQPNGKPEVIEHLDYFKNKDEAHRVDKIDIGSTNFDFLSYISMKEHLLIELTVGDVFEATMLTITDSKQFNAIARAKANKNEAILSSPAVAPKKIRGAFLGANFMAGQNSSWKTDVFFDFMITHIDDIPVTIATPELKFISYNYDLANLVSGAEPKEGGTEFIPPINGSGTGALLVKGLAFHCNSTNDFADHLFSGTLKKINSTSSPSGPPIANGQLQSYGQGQPQSYGPPPGQPQSYGQPPGQPQSYGQPTRVGGKRSNKKTLNKKRKPLKKSKKSKSRKYKRRSAK